VRSPPLQGGLCKLGWPCGEELGTARRPIFSEGRGLRVRKDWPDANRCTTRSRRGKRTPSGLPGACLGQAGALVAGVRSPPLRGEADPNAAWLAGKGPGKARRRFSRRDALRASVWYGRPDARAFHPHRMVDDERVTKRAHASIKRQHSLRACGARPSTGMGTQERGPYVVHPGVREGRICRRDAVSASAKTGLTQTDAQHAHGGGKRTPSGLPGSCLGQAQGFFNGRAEPAPPRRGRPQRGLASGERPREGARAVFSEGRTPCVRLATPDSSRRIAFSPVRLR
jgi:hypothetical protein